ncbi:MAG: type II toxin-antitoxin system Phd/YefM family antitoxin [Microcystaceae cyanobacterium]
MKTIPLVDIQQPLSTYVEQAQDQGPIVITSNGKAIAVLIAPIDDDLESLLLLHSSELQGILNQSRQSIKIGQGLTADKFWERVENSVEDSES